MAVSIWIRLWLYDTDVSYNQTLIMTSQGYLAVPVIYQATAVTFVCILWL